MKPRTASGQSAAEFAFILPLLLVMLLVAITFAVVGQAALAVSQLAYNGARYAAVNPQLSASQTASYIQSGALGAPTIIGPNLSVTVAPASGFGQPVTVTVSYDLSNNSLVSSMSTIFSALGLGRLFSTTLTVSESAMSE